MKTSTLTKEQLKEIRLNLGISPTEMAAKLGISTSCLYFLENGKLKINLAIGELAKSFKN
jgi:DNA-binding XRE family transcriptional regulator